MTNIEKLEHDVQKLDREELAAFREWFRQYDDAEWDQQIEEDIREGRMDKLAEEALAEHEAGTTKEL